MFHNYAGIHWRDSRSPRLRYLAGIQTMNYYPELEDPIEDSNGEIDVIFGSTGATIMLQRIDSEVIGLFSYGYCTLLALAIHDKTGLPLMLFTKTYDIDGWSGHAGILVGENQVLDISGVHNVTDLQKDYKTSQGQVVNREEFLVTTCAAEYVDDPYSFLEELEQLVLDDFANYIIKENKLTVSQNM